MVMAKSSDISFWRLLERVEKIVKCMSVAQNVHLSILFVECSKLLLASYFTEIFIEVYSSKIEINQQSSNSILKTDLATLDLN